MKVHDGHMEIHKYWDFDYPDAGEERKFESIEAAAEEFEDLLRGAVRRRLVGEMPMCRYISGGLDSTTILGLGCQGIEGVQLCHQGRVCAQESVQGKLMIFSGW